MAKFKVIKLSKKQRSMEPGKLLTALGLVEGNIASPDRLYVSKNDYKSIEQEVTKIALEEYPYLGKKSRRIQSIVGMHMLNLGPNTSLQDAIKDGYALIEEKE